jgi:two-component system chemotaxis response regulator CheY
MMRDILKEGGIAEILEAQDGLEAVELYRNHRPDLVFMDIVMPKQNGLDALVAIREYDQAARVIIASSAGTHKNLKSAIDAGACDFIQKPFEKEAVLAMLRRNLEGEWD